MRDSFRERPMRLPQPTPYRSATLVLVLIVLALLLLLLDEGGMLGPARSHAESLVSPVMLRMRRVAGAIGQLSQGFGDTRQLQTENAALREQISQLQAQAIRLKALELENARLRAQLRIEQEHAWKLLGAEISARSPDPGRRILLLAAGSDEGVRPGMAVIGKEGANPPALIGVVDQVGPHSASVLLITDFSSSVSALVLHQGGAADGIVQGQWQRGSHLLLEEVDRAAPLAAGDTVVSAGLSAQFGLDLPRAAVPRNVPIGTIERVRSDRHSQVADVRPFADPDRMSHAWVILSAGD